ncbi:ABC transporter substrate-binding protein [Allomesorhizobium camelthorni]|uniref:Solute-binding protein family 5 domain-containing protein n=1 Tax=Allomesorhizobium camelthorni TaxID=475069 RepID=A0A6G4WKC7_9HYPH|nr:ABC transporter substrate-binding protein [Mesorhizobium camelthorni]NGO55265.1 hypothetical protein [Mesorhizobium camelthorni]
MDLIYQPLSRMSQQGEVVPSLGEGWEVCNENLTLKLKAGITFHDDTPREAEAVAWTVYILEAASPNAFFLGPLEQAEAIDPLTVAQHFRQPLVPVWVGLTPLPSASSRGRSIARG